MESTARNRDRSRHVMLAWRTMPAAEQDRRRMARLLSALLAELRHEELAESTGILQDWRTAQKALERARRALEGMK